MSDFQYYPECGEKLLDDANYCHKCGRKAESKIESTETSSEDEGSDLAREDYRQILEEELRKAEEAE